MSGAAALNASVLFVNRVRSEPSQSISGAPSWA